jgi:hypothetical protein
MPPDNFTPTGAFEGYVYAKLEDITEKFKALPCKETENRLSKVENEISHIKGKASIIGAIAGIISAFIAKHLFGK